MLRIAGYRRSFWFAAFAIVVRCSDATGATRERLETLAEYCRRRGEDA